MYRALCTCQLLHPDPQDSVSEEEEGEFEFGAMAGGEDQHQEDDGGSHNGHNGTQDMDVAEGQFEDAN